jgi:SAM-dependent methyltransferase
MDRTGRLLEIGCGEGTGLLVAKNLGFERLVGVEVSKERLNRAKKKLGEHTDLILVSPDNRLPFRDASFATAISAAVIEHTVAPEGFIREIARVVRPGGYIVIESDCWQWRILQMLGIYQSIQPVDKAIFPSRLISIFKKSGLRLMHYDGFPMPGGEWLFLRWLIVKPVTRQVRRVRSYGRRLWRKTSQLFAAQQVQVRGPQVRKPKPKVTIEDFDRAVNEKWTPSKGLWSVAFFRLIFSNENVFFLEKQFRR